jgi:hypothetical protein
MIVAVARLTCTVEVLTAWLLRVQIEWEGVKALKSNVLTQVFTLALVVIDTIWEMTLMVIIDYVHLEQPVNLIQILLTTQSLALSPEEQRKMLSEPTVKNKKRNVISENKKERKNASMRGNWSSPLFQLIKKRESREK